MTVLAAGPAARAQKPTEEEMAQLTARFAQFWEPLKQPVTGSEGSGALAVVCPQAATSGCEEAHLVPVVLTKPTPQELWLDAEVSLAASPSWDTHIV